MSRPLATRAVTALVLSTARALDKLLERGAPGPAPGSKRGGRRYDVAAIATWRAERQARLQPTYDLSAERAQLARVQRQLVELKVREARGQLIRAADAEHVQRSIAAAVKAQLLAVPRRAVLGGLPREHELLVRTLIVEALRELSEIRTLAALEERAS
jgi:phage terminase Nu1 subunit (DNA packaging protein)